MVIDSVNWSILSNKSCFRFFCYDFNDEKFSLSQKSNQIIRFRGKNATRMCIKKMVNLKSGSNNLYIKVPGRGTSKNWSTLMKGKSVLRCIEVQATTWTFHAILWHLYFCGKLAFGRIKVLYYQRGVKSRRHFVLVASELFCATIACHSRNLLWFFARE